MFEQAKLGQTDHIEKGTTHQEEDIEHEDDALKVVSEERIELTEEDVSARKTSLRAELTTEPTDSAEDG